MTRNNDNFVANRQISCLLPKCVFPDMSICEIEIRKSSLKYLLNIR